MPDGIAFPLLIGAALVGVVLGMVISFMRMANPVLVGVYAVVEGAFLGLVSKAFESFYDASSCRPPRPRSACSS